MQDKQARTLILNALNEGAQLRLQMIEQSLDVIMQACHLLRDCLQRDGKILLFGNGGSAADSQHIAAEFVCRFSRDRAALSAIALTTDSSALTAIANDYGFDRVFARQIDALCRPEDVVIAISTSGQSPNVIAGIDAARARGARTIGLTGGDGGAMLQKVDLAIVVPTNVTARVQECHITIGHLICEVVESLLQSVE